MSIKTDSELIRDETGINKNTATRVGGVLVDIATDLEAKQLEINDNTEKITYDDATLVAQHTTDISENNASIVAIQGEQTTQDTAIGLNASEIAFLQANQYSGVITFETFAELPTTGVINTSYKVTNDSNTALNGYYHWSGSAYVKDANLANGVIESGNVDAVSGGTVFEGIKYKTDSIPNKNVFDKTQILADYYIKENGDLVLSATYYNASDYIPVIVGQRYTSNYGMRFTCYYDNNKNVVLGGSSTSITTFTVPNGVSFIRVSLVTSSSPIDTFQLEKGAISTDYESFFLVLNSELIQDLSLTPDKLENSSLIDSKIVFKGIAERSCSFLERGKNLFDRTNPDIIRGSYLNSVGVLSSNSSYSVSHYIEIQEGKYYFCNTYYGGAPFYAFYDANKVFISASNNTSVIVAPTNSVFIRYTLWLPTATDINSANIQIEEGTIATTYEEFISNDTLKIENLPKIYQDVYNLPNEIIQPKNTTIFASTTQNHINVDDIDFKENHYLNGDGVGFTPSVSYNTTGFIYVFGESKAFITDNGAISGVEARFSCFYDIDKNFIAGTYLQNYQKLDIPVDAYYLRASYRNDYLKPKIEIGLVDSELYTPYEYGIGTQYVPKTIKRDTVECFLPSEIYVGLGTIIELYNNQVCYIGNDENFTYQWVADTGSKKIGTVYTDKFRIDTSSGNTALLGDYVLTLAVIDNNNNKVAEAISTLKVVNVVADIPTPLRILPVGDSLTNKVWLPETRLLMNTIFGKNVIEFVGTLEYYNQSEIEPQYLKHEGRGGWRSDQYLDEGFANDNPFWNTGTLAVDFAWYFAQNSIAEPDAFLIMLGTNNITDVASTIEFIELIQTQMTNKKVYVILPQYSGDYLINKQKRRNFFDYSKDLTEYFASTSNVFIIPNAYSHDSEHNFGWVEEDINPRNTLSPLKNYRPLDVVHPQECGYFQFADSVFSTILANY